MMSKTTIAYLIFTIALLYIVSPWFFEKELLFNEVLAGIGLLLFIRSHRIDRGTIGICMLLLLLLAAVHACTSLLRMDTLYYYFRNSVIFYSMFTYFIGYYLYKYLPGYITRTRPLLRKYIGIFLFVPNFRLLFERFGVSMLFPALFRRAAGKWVPLLLVAINIIYGFTYDSLTALVLAAFYLLLFISPGYKFFKQTMIIGLVLFAIVFIYLIPYLSIISHHYNYYTDDAISEVRASNRLLRVDANNTWRLILWKQIIVDNFPKNLLGLGFGTPAITYFPIEDYTKIASLPYLIGAHNSFIYLFGRLGFLFILLIVPIYRDIFREYFYQKAYYYANNGILIFWSFFAVTIVVSFNPALESPIFAGAYWLILGLTAACIRERTLTNSNHSPA
jgi:hypothetical protein